MQEKFILIFIKLRKLNNNNKKMKNVITIAFICILLGHVGCNSQNKMDIRAICRTDNDFTTTYDSIGKLEIVPLKVGVKINSIVDSCKNISINNSIDYRVFKVKYSAKVNIYILKLTMFNKIEYTFLLYNQIGNHISSLIPFINGKWMDNEEEGFYEDSKLISKPLIYFEDLTGDNCKEIIIKERVHNGTAYNAVIEHIFQLDSYMNLKKLLCVESICLTMSESQTIKRKFKYGIIDVSLWEKERFIKKIASIKLSQDPYQITSRKVFDEKFDAVIISYSGVPEQLFLQKGYLFKY